MKNISQQTTIHTKQHKINPVEKQILIQYLLNQNIKGFDLHLTSLKDIINLLLKSQGEQSINKH